MTSAQLKTVIGHVDVSMSIVVRWSSATVQLGTYWSGVVIRKTPADAAAHTPGFLHVDYGQYGSCVVFPPPAGSASVHSVTYAANTDPYGDGHAKVAGGRAQDYDPFNVSTWGMYIEAGSEQVRRTQLTQLMRELRVLFRVPTSGRLEKRANDEHAVNNLLLIIVAWVRGAQKTHSLGATRWDTDEEYEVADAVIAALGVYHVKWNQGSVVSYHSHLEKDGAGLRGRITEAVRLGLEKKGKTSQEADRALGLIS